MAGGETIEDQITEAIRLSRSGYLAAGSIGNKIRRNIFVVRATLDRMVRHGRLECTAGEFPSKDRFSLVVDGVAMMAMPVRVAPALPVAVRPSDDDGDDGVYSDDDLLMEDKREAVHAAKLWRERMGERRWREDPRALKEVCGKQFLPFSEPR